MSDHVVSAISESGVVENVGAAAGTASILFPFKSYYYFRFWWPPFFISDVGRCLTMSSVPYLSPAWSIIWGQLLEPHRNLFPFKRHFYFRFWCPPFFLFRMSADVGQCRQCHIRVGRGRKCGGSRWNRVEIYFSSKVIATSGLFCWPPLYC